MAVNQRLLSALNSAPKERRDLGMEFGRFLTTARALFTRLEHTPAEVTQAVGDQIEAMFSRIVERTPVDRSPGRDEIVAKELWQKEMEVTGEIVTWIISNSATNPENDFPYPGTGEYNPFTLEYGWSGQAPDGMVRISLEEFRMALSAEIKLLKAGG